MRPRVFPPFLCWLEPWSALKINLFIYCKNNTLFLTRSQASEFGVSVGEKEKKDSRRSRKESSSLRAEFGEGLWSRAEAGGRDAGRRAGMGTWGGTTAGASVRTNRERQARSWHSEVWWAKNRWEDRQSLGRRARRGGCCYRETWCREALAYNMGRQS